MKFRTVAWLAVAVLVLVGCERGAEEAGPIGADEPVGEALTALAQCLTNGGWVMYSSSTCSACRAQRKAFGAAFSQITEIECNPHAPESQVERCLERKIRKTPTWIAERDGQEVDRLEGYQLLDALANHAGCPL